MIWWLLVAILILTWVVAYFDVRRRRGTMIEVWAKKSDGTIDYFTTSFLWQVDIELRRRYPSKNPLEDRPMPSALIGYHWHQANTGCHGSGVIGYH